MDSVFKSFLNLSTHVEHLSMEVVIFKFLHIRPATRRGVFRYLNLNKTKYNSYYDLIVLDAMHDLYEHICSPISFLSLSFVRKIRQILSLNGVVALNTLPPYCMQHVVERNLYMSTFGTLYVATHDANRVLLTVKVQVGGKKDLILPGQDEIKHNVNNFKRKFYILDINSDWLFKSFDNMKQNHQLLFASTFTTRTTRIQLFSRAFFNNTCFLWNGHFVINIDKINIRAAKS